MRIVERPVDTSRVGTTLAGKYRLIRLLGAGGMGAVYEAEHAWTERRVAVKLMLGDAVRDTELAARFLREARAASRIRHPNIVDVLDMGADPADGALYLVQELLVGTDLRALLDERTALPPKDALEILTPIMAALVAAHRNGVVHRDIKPENIFLASTEAGVVPKLIDFGIARLNEPAPRSALTRTGSAIGTPYYMSPEQALGERTVDEQSDVWSIGVVLFESMAGKLPLDGDNYNATIGAILTAPIPRLDAIVPTVPKAIADVIARAITRDRAARFRSMQEMLGALLDAPTFDSEPWHDVLRTTHRKAAQAERPRETLDDELIATPKASPERRVSRPFSEGSSWMDDDPTAIARLPPGDLATPAAVAPDRLATTLGRTARELPSSIVPPGVSAAAVRNVLFALLGAGAFTVVYVATHRHAPTVIARPAVAPTLTTLPLAPAPSTRLVPVPSEALAPPSGLATPIAGADAGSTDTRLSAARTTPAAHTSPAAPAHRPPGDAPHGRNGAPIIGQ